MPSIMYCKRENLKNKETYDIKETRILDILYNNR